MSARALVASTGGPTLSSPVGHTGGIDTAIRPRADAAPQAPVREREPDTESRQEEARPWNVVVWDDPVNLMSYVVFVLRRVFGYPEPKARKLMLEVHHLGKAVVASEPRERAEMYVQQLHAYGLHATMERA